MEATKEWKVVDPKVYPYVRMWIGSKKLIAVARFGGGLGEGSRMASGKLERHREEAGQKQRDVLVGQGRPASRVILREGVVSEKDEKPPAGLGELCAVE